MTRQLFGAAILLAVVAAAMASPQAQQAAKQSTKQSAAVKRVSGWIKTSAYVPPKTPWGDPDIQGGYSNVNENGIPFEKPGNLSNQVGGEVDDSELAELNRERNERALNDVYERFVRVKVPYDEITYRGKQLVLRMRDPEKQLTIDNELVWCVLLSIGDAGPPVDVHQWRDEFNRPIQQLSMGLVDQVRRMKEHPADVSSHRRRNDELRETVLGFINAKAQARDEAALVWMLQRTILALLNVYPQETGPGMIRHHVNQVLPEGASE